MQVLIHTNDLWYIFAIYFRAIENVTIANVKQKPEETSDDDCLCLLNIFC